MPTRRQIDESIIGGYGESDGDGGGVGSGIDQVIICFIRLPGKGQRVPVCGCSSGITTAYAIDYGLVRCIVQYDGRRNDGAQSALTIDACTWS